MFLSITVSESSRISPVCSSMMRSVDPMANLRLATTTSQHFRTDAHAAVAPVVIQRLNDFVATPDANDVAGLQVQRLGRGPRVRSVKPAIAAGCTPQSLPQVEHPQSQHPRPETSLLRISRSAIRIVQPFLVFGKARVA
jgi:hypothetical protein